MVRAGVVWILGNLFVKLVKYVKMSLDGGLRGSKMTAAKKEDEPRHHDAGVQVQQKESGRKMGRMRGSVNASELDFGSGKAAGGKGLIGSSRLGAKPGQSDFQRRNKR
jgi:hypothetical protein